MSKEQTIKSEMIYEGRILNLRVDTVELKNRKYSKREIVEHANAVTIIAMKDDKIVFVRQYRKAVDKELLELPAGLIESNELPKEAAQRELQEEIKYDAKNFEYLFDSYSSPGFTDEKMSYFLATDLFSSPLQEDEGEDLNIEEYTLEGALNMIEEGKIEDSKTIIGLLYLKARKS
ncbi:NUDIX hydrolase [Mediannikoviicoccus vaginalis]|uniref:NUDIX hydrolase n=1 Tax=Mediannikoviicoccus vaginalis TaxID=2899727 RepID=UPI001F270AFF|nr:NUDIX hydrolase [Mediannikoviicoccus vaginalis]